MQKISIKQVQDARFIREAIETAVVRRAAQIVDQATLMQLAQNLEQQSLACAQADMAGFLVLDDAFHAQLASSIDCTSAWDSIENLKAHMDRVRYLTLGQISPLGDLLAQHQQIYAALTRHDEDAAVNAIHSHLQELTLTLIAVSERYPDWFE
ncbi:DNA-binding GntR family transcriptional regulator [Silvimonas terrae]|uniref:DNA-binding GntR family transcriptional regulator n=1 Tax=Silvimonas terrae TaxID=300266 RepID=A0A840RFS2_9NEIS|nr:GntR family transcriptional regulator [Silvimonas terrae]MBB5191368.1 DNA-binding GntR family transcriptional regulator [Silvimonas terrae]